MNNEGRSRAPPLQNLQSPVVGVGVLDDPFYIDRRDVRRPSPYKFPAKKDGFRRPFHYIYSASSSKASSRKLTGRKPSLQEIMADLGSFIQPS